MPSLRRSALTILALAAAAFVGSAALTPSSAAASETFDDVTSAGYGPAIDALVEEGVVAGCGNGDFCPDGELTRGQMATLLAEALSLPYEGSGWFADVDGTSHARGINSLAAAGLTYGCSAIEFCPDEPVTRGQIASLLDRGFAPPLSDDLAFDDIAGVHEASINALAAAGIAAGCSESLTRFCVNDPVLRWQAALFLARAMNLIERVDLDPLEERREQQAEIEAEEQRRLEEEQRRLEEQRLEEERLEQERLEQERLAEERAARDRIWDDLAQCEAGGNWHINTGNGYYGGLQFALRSWRAVGGTGYPHQHSREEQIRRGEKLLKIQGWGAWPACSLRLGYR